MPDIEEVNWIPFAERPEWKDVKPIYLNEEEKGVVNINYSPQFTETFAYLRAILEADEKSERAFILTSEAIFQNPANYTVWQFRRMLLKFLNKDLNEELLYCETIITSNPKNYQVWHHRHVLVEWLNDPSEELAFTALILREDAKNYHAWQHRHWVVEQFALWDGQLDFSDKLLKEDLRNNSAWNYRYFIISKTTGFSVDVLDSEKRYAMELIEKAVHNESAWNYLNGICRDTGLSQHKDIWQFCEKLYLDSSKKRANHLLAMMVDYLDDYTERSAVNNNQTTLSDLPCNPSSLRHRIDELCEELCSIDAIRKNYWSYVRDTRGSKMLDK